MSESFTNAPYDGKTNLSVIVPLYNSSAFVERIAGQLMNQKTKYNYEIIFVDDGSTDDTADKLRKLCVEGGGSITFIQQENQGAGVARNTGLNTAKGEYVAFVDSDDEVTELFIEKVLGAAYGNGADMVKCRHGMRINGKVCAVKSSSGYIWGGVYSRNIFQKIRFPESSLHEDMINGFLISPQITKGKFIDDVLYFYNIHGNNKSIKGRLSFRCLEHIYLAKGLIHNYYRLGLKDENYLLRKALNECSGLAVKRTGRLDEYTRKQVFLACHEIISSFKHKPSALSAKEQIFYDAIMSKDFTAWNLAAKL